jgi:hypothetical protein
MELYRVVRMANLSSGRGFMSFDVSRGVLQIQYEYSTGTAQIRRAIQPRYGM